MEENVQNKNQKPIYKKWWFWVLIVLGISLVVSMASGDSDDGSSDDSDSSSSSSSGDKSSSSGKITYETVDLQTMLDELDSNALKAEKNYQNKYVKVTEKIASFDSDGSYITIEPVDADEWNFDTVMCKIKNDDQLDYLMDKSVGDTVTIKGKITSIGEVLGYTIKIDEIG
ncbi:MAG: hypothetical protein IJY23_08800 [Clostridia bacterium]|nr:hypothetical protein [Clostridia bacterium]